MPPTSRPLKRAVSGPRRSRPTTRHAKAITRLFETASLGAPENAVGFVLWRVVHRYQRDVDQSLEALDLTHLQFMTLILVAWLGRSGEPVTQSTLSRFGDIQPMQVSHMLKTLEAKDLVARSRSTADVRAKHIKVTAAGLATLGRALPIVIDVQRRLFGTEGSAGGALLAALLRADSAPSTRQRSGARPPPPGIPLADPRTGGMGRTRQGPR